MEALRSLIDTYTSYIKPLRWLLSEVFPEVDDISRDHPGKASHEPDPGDHPLVAGDHHQEGGDEHEQAEAGCGVEVCLHGGRHILSPGVWPHDQSEQGSHTSDIPWTLHITSLHGFGKYLVVLIVSDLSMLLSPHPQHVLSLSSSLSSLSFSGVYL